MEMTQHASERCAQRGIPKDIVETIWFYGTEKSARGAVSLTLDRAAIDLAAEDDRHFRAKLENYRGAYVIAAGAKVITTARQTRRYRN